MNPFRFFKPLTKPFTVRVRAGVLQLTLGIAIIIAVMCSAIILLAWYSRISILNNGIRNTLRDNAESGIQYLIGTRETFPFHQTHTIDLFGDETDSVRITRIPWGIFEVYTSCAFRGANEYRKTAMITAGFSDETSLTLFMPENNATVYLAGDAKISGTVSLSERQLSSGNAGGRTFEGEKLLDGDYKISDSHMPAMDTTLLLRLKGWLNGSLDYGKTPTLEALPLQAAVFPFSGDRINLFSQKEPLELRDSLQGNLVIHSATSIRVTRNAYLSDVLVVAPVIEIEEGFEGRAQFIAGKLITVAENVKLHYPSSLVLVGYPTDSLVLIRKGAVVEGIVAIPGHSRDVDSNSVFRIEKGGTLHGLAYINASADIQGSVWGNLTTRRVQTMVDKAVYYNHILDAELSLKRKSPDMPASLLWGTGKPDVIARWIE